MITPNMIIDNKLSVFGDIGHVKQSLTDRSNNFSHLSPKASINYQVNNSWSVYLRYANPRKGIQDFTNIALANNTCVCCRIAIDENKEGKLAVFLRHIYGDNIREFALVTLNETK